MDSENYKSNSTQLQNLFNTNAPDNKLFESKLISEKEKMSVSAVSFVNSQETSIAFIKNNLQDKNRKFLMYKKQYTYTYNVKLSIMMTFIVYVIFVYYFMIFHNTIFLKVMECMIPICLVINIVLTAYIIKKDFELTQKNDILRTNMLFGVLYSIFWVVVNVGKLYCLNLPIKNNDQICTYL